MVGGKEPFFLKNGSFVGESEGVLGTVVGCCD